MLVCPCHSGGTLVRLGAKDPFKERRLPTYRLFLISPALSLLPLSFRSLFALHLSCCSPGADRTFPVSLFCLSLCPSVPVSLYLFSLFSPLSVCNKTSHLSSVCLVCLPACLGHPCLPWNPPEFLTALFLALAVRWKGRHNLKQAFES